MKTEILTALRETDGFLSGQALSERFHVSRTAVWKMIDQLKHEGYEIESVSRKGYRLLSSPDRLSKHALLSSRDTEWIGETVVYSDEIDSTNNQAKRVYEDYPHGTLFVADCQKSGRGRRGRDFDSPGGTGIFMTLLLKPDIAPDHASRLTLLAAMAVQKGIEETAALSAGIKWPNDVILSGKKVSGILTEMSAEEGTVHYVIIGIGINAHNTDFPEEIRDVATSILIEGGKRISRVSLVWSIWRAFEELYAAYLPTQDLSRLVEEYDRLLLNRDREVEVLDPNAPFTGVARGINERGELLVETGTGMVPVSSGEVSVRGVYGYV